ncbi:MAG: hypothetical protein COS40_00860 [Deltaproteobacteria bacterium CG03_land_8_20_14_0_80_45_14]|nr:MAG: hypothetical protein COS40_00860 [Deltaproteobacteria bacterium CG03_land_8_20_14_0_80_45_14]
MFIRIKRGGNRSHPHDYLQVVESYREGISVRQRVIATLGRLDQLRAEGQLDGLVKSLCRFSVLAGLGKVPKLGLVVPS